MKLFNIFKKKPINNTPKEFQIGGYWGNSIRWSNPEIFQTKIINDKSLISCYGFLWDKPKVGDRLKGEFLKSWMIFEFVEIQPCYDPPDMFFAKVKPKEQHYK